MDHVELQIRAYEFTGCFGLGCESARLKPVSESGRIISLDCPFRHIQKGKALRLIVGDEQAAPESSRMAILKAIARARLWYDQLVSGGASDLRDLSRLHNVSPRYIRVIFRLASLSPAAVESISNQQYRPELTMNELCRLAKMPWKTLISLLNRCRTQRHLRLKHC